jgi:hypothetical protein
MKVDKKRKQIEKQKYTQRKKARKTCRLERKKK